MANKKKPAKKQPVNPQKTSKPAPKQPGKKKKK